MTRRLSSDARFGKLWLVRRCDSDAVDVARCKVCPRIALGGRIYVPIGEAITFLDRLNADEFTGISIPKGHVVPVESITITLAGASRKAKVQG